MNQRFTRISIKILGQPPIESQPPFDDDDDEPAFKRDVDPACAETPDSGSGQQLLHVWYFKLEIAQCRELLFRGYGGSANMFPTRRECERRCLRHYTEGAEQFGPKLKATVEHLVDKSNSRKKLFSHRSTQIDYEFRQRKGRNGSYFSFMLIHIIVFVTFYSVL